MQVSVPVAGPVPVVGSGNHSGFGRVRRLTLVLPSMIEDSGDGGVSHMYIRTTSAVPVQQYVEDEDEESGAVGDTLEAKDGESAGDLTSLARSAAGSPLDRSSARQSGLSKPTLSPSKIRFSPPSQYPPEANVAVCMAPGCRTAFNLFHRRYRCRMCGKLFCFTCCSYEINTAPTSFLPAGSPRQVAPSGNVDRLEPWNASDAPWSATVETESATRVCRQCYYEAQLVLSRRQPNGELRRRCRGEFKLFQRSLLLNIFSFLTRLDLAEVSRVSSDFYFLSRDNLIWYQHNMQRWITESESPRLNTMSPSTITWQAKQPTAASTTFQVAPVLQDATRLSNNEAAKRVISLHARYNYTQFLDYARRLEMAQRDGLSSFMLGARILFSSAVKIAVIGPSHVGKTAAIRAFMGEDTSKMVVLPTTGFTRYTKMVRLRGAIKTEVVLHIYDLSGSSRYEPLRRFVCRHVHAIGLCYDPTRKVTLVEAADMMMAMEDSLGPQPVVVCGLLPFQVPGEEHSSATPPLEEARAGTSPTSAGGSGSPRIEVQPADAKSITVRGRRSLNCALLETSDFYQELLQCLLDRIALATIEKRSEESVESVLNERAVGGEGGKTPTSSTTTRQMKRPKADQTVARALLNMTMQPSPLDILFDM